MAEPEIGLESRTSEEIISDVSAGALPIESPRSLPPSYEINGTEVSEVAFREYTAQEEQLVFETPGTEGDTVTPQDIPKGWEIVEPETIPEGWEVIENPEQITSINLDAPENEPVKIQVDKNIDDLTALANDRFSPEQLEEWKDNPIDAEHAPEFMGYSDWLPLGGIYRGVESVKLMSIAKKLEEGEDVTDAEKKNLNQWIDKHVELSLRGFTWGGATIYHGAGMPAFMLEFAATFGIGKSAQVAATKALTGVATAATIKSAVTLAAKAKTAGVITAGVTARVATMGALLPGMYVDQYGNRRLQDRLNITEQGEVIFKASTETPLKAALMAFTYTNVEVVSELSGARILKGVGKLGDLSGINKFVIDPVTTRVKTALTTSLTKLPEKVKLALFDAYKKIQPNARVSEVFTKAGWHGLLGEFSEERLADILRGATGYAFEDGYTFDDSLTEALGIFDKDRFLLEVGLLSLMKTGQITINAIGNNYRYLKDEMARDALKNLSEAELQNLLDQNLSMIEEAPVVGFPAVPFINTPVLVKTKDIPETRGKGQQYHGTSSTINILDEVSYSSLNIYGQGFYTTDAIDVAKGYSKKGKGKSNAVYKIKIVNDPLLYDLDAPISLDDRAVVEDILDDLYPLYENNAGEEVHLNTLGEIFDAVRQESDQSADYIQESFDVVQEILRKDGYAGYKHVGGKFTKSKPHNVEIYWNPTNNIVLGDPTMLALEFESTLDQDYVNELYTGFRRITPPAQVDKPKSVIDYTESMWAKLRANWNDDFRPVLLLLEVAEARGIKLEVGENPRILRKAFLGSIGKVKMNLEDNTFYYDISGNKVVTGLGYGKILEDFDNAVMQTERSPKQRQADFDSYLIATRNLEDLMDMEEVAVSEEQLEQSRLDLMTLSAKYGDSFEWFNRQAEELYGFQRRILYNFVRSGNMSQKEYDEHVAKHPHYVPFQRILEEHDYIDSPLTKTGFTAAAKSAIIKMIKGSELEIKSPLLSMISNTTRIISIADRNSVARSIVNLKSFLPEYIQSSKGNLEIIVNPKTNEPVLDPKTGKALMKTIPKESDIVVYVNGKRKLYQVPPMVLEAMQGLDPVQLTGLNKLLVGSVKVFRTGTTSVPSFVMKNVFRDQFVAHIQSGSSVLPRTPIDTIQGLMSIIGNGEMYKEWQSSGGAQSFYMDLSDQGLIDAAKELYNKDGLFKKYAKTLGIRAILDAGSVAENATRVGVFIAAKRRGLSDLEAMVESRDSSIDFAVGGKHGKIANRYIPFLNVGINGTIRMAEAFKKNPKLTTMKALATITIPSIAIAGWYLYGADEDERREYLEIPTATKDMNWVWKANGKWHSAPKPFSFGYIFGTMPEKFMRWMYDGDKPEGEKMWQELGAGFLTSVSPISSASGLLPPIAKAVFEVKSNYDFHWDSPLTSPYLENVDPELRYTKGTSETAKWIGEQYGLSPAKVEKFMKNIVGGTTPYITGAGDQVLSRVRELNNEINNVKPDSDRANILTRAWNVDDPIGTTSLTMSTFFKVSNEVARKKRSYNRLPDYKQYAYEKKHKFIFDNADIMTDTSKEVSVLLGEVYELREDYRLDGARKEKRISILEKEAYLLARDANRIWFKQLKKATSDL
jgi:hypothetical protein